MAAGTAGPRSQVRLTVTVREVGHRTSQPPGLRLATWFYRLRLTRDGRYAGLSRLPIPPLPGNESADGLALTPDGSRLAIAVQVASNFNGSGRGTIEVASTVTGAVRRWDVVSGGEPWQVSWADNHRLGFFWQPDGGSNSLAGLWLLDTALPGRTLLARLAVPDHFSARQFPADAAVLAPGGRIAVVTFTARPPRRKSTLLTGIADVSLGTGRVLRLIPARTAVPWGGPREGRASGPCPLLAAAPQGQHLLVACGQFGRVDNGRFTPLPGFANDVSFPVAW